MARPFVREVRGKNPEHTGGVRVRIIQQAPAAGFRSLSGSDAGGRFALPGVGGV
jgi:hypothetical protein